jgi:ribosomal protein L24
MDIVVYIAGDMNMIKFHYGDKVKIIGGFYSGRNGRVTNIIHCFPFRDEYMVDIEGFVLGVCIEEKDMQAV